MMLIFELRAKITALYQKYAFWFNLAARFILSYIAFSRIKSVLNYNPSLGKSVVILALSAICAVLPSTLMVFISAVYATLQIYAASDNSLILAINRPIEMLVTALNVVGDTACAIAVAKSEDALDVAKYEA